MSPLFRRPSAKRVPSTQDDPNSAFSSLLAPAATRQPFTYQTDQPSHRRTKSSSALLAGQDNAAALSSRPWLSLLVAERSSWTGDRPPQRKLVKDPGSGGSARPSFSVELGDDGDERAEGKQGGVGVVRRGVERIRELYRREKG